VNGIKKEKMHEKQTKKRRRKNKYNSNIASLSIQHLMHHWEIEQR
jgi:hypothetical protein